MKYIGGINVVLYAAVAYSAWEPLTRAQRGAAGVRGSSVRLWTGGYMGGK